MSARIFATIQLVRPLNLTLSVAGVAIGAVLAIGWDAFSARHGMSVAIAMISAAAIGSAANALNDLFDVEIDRINRPDRPIPSGRVSDRAARMTWVIGAAIGVGLSLLLTPVHIGIAVLAVVAVVLYSYRLKTFGFVGNAAVALVTSATLIYGGLATGQIGAAWVGFIAAFLITLAREITKDLEDIEGDRIGGVRSLPIALGPTPAGRIVVALIVITVLSAPLPFTHLGFSGLYLVVVAVTSFTLLVAVWTLVGTPKQTVNYGRTSILLKSAMVIGMLALAVS